MIIIGVTRNSVECPPKEIKYVYIPRTFEQEQEDPVPISDLFGKMFEEPSPWVSNFVQPEDIEDGYISQS